MFADLLQQELWRKKLEKAGFRIISPSSDKKIQEEKEEIKPIECQKCGKMSEPNSSPCGCPVI